MKNEVLPRCKRTRWHNVIRDSSIQRGGADIIPCIPHRHSRVGGPFIGTRTIRRKHLSAKGRESRRDSSETRQSIAKRNLGEQPFAHIIDIGIVVIEVHEIRGRRFCLYQ